MKLQLLYVFIFAAPLLVRLLSPEPTSTAPASESIETAPAKIEPAEPPAKKDEAKDTKKEREARPAEATPAQTVRSYTFR